MVYTCLVPGCKTGYKSEKNSKKLTLFGFLNDEKLKQNWIAAIPCKNWVINKNHKVFSKHFLSDDIQMITVDSHDKRRCDRNNQTLQQQRLKQGAIPKIFLELPKYLSAAIPKPRSGLSSSTAQCLQREMTTNQLNGQFLKEDRIDYFNGLMNKIRLSYYA